MSLSLQPPSNLDFFLFPVSEFKPDSNSSALSAMKQAGIGVAYWDFDNHAIYWSKELTALHGLLSNQFYHRTYQDHLAQIYPADRVELKASIEQVKTLLQTKQIEYRITINNQERWLRSSFSPGISHGQLTHIIEVVSDISDLKAAQAILLESEARWRKLLGCISDVVLETTLSGEIISATESITPLWGYSPDEIRGSHLSSMIEFEDFSLDLPNAIRPDFLPISVMANVLYKYYSWRSTQCSIHIDLVRQTLLFIFKPTEPSPTIDFYPQWQTAIASMANTSTYQYSLCHLHSYFSS